MNDTSDVNISPRQLTTIASPILRYKDTQLLNGQLRQRATDSLEVTNEEPINGDVSIPSAEELKQRVFSYYAAQNRAVTLNDYKAISYAMPPRFGGINKCSFERDFDQFKRNLNMYVISKDRGNNLEATNTTIKNNLKTWLSQYKMINDTIDVKPARVVNFGINFFYCGRL